MLQPRAHSRQPPSTRLLPAAKRSCIVFSSTSTSKAKGIGYRPQESSSLSRSLSSQSYHTPPISGHRKRTLILTPLRAFKWHARKACGARKSHRTRTIRAPPVLLATALRADCNQSWRIPLRALSMRNKTRLPFRAPGVNYAVQAKRSSQDRRTPNNSDASGCCQKPASPAPSSSQSAPPKHLSVKRPALSSQGGHLSSVVNMGHL